MGGDVELSFRTRGMKNPKGLPRVFFASHPDDRDVFLNMVWEIFDQYQDIALFYEEDPLSQAELLSRLTNMQLIVIPITSRLLTAENPVVSDILPFAGEKHIPILPLMMEKGLEMMFCELFGSLQYLTPGENDPTAIPFKQKMNKYLEGVLVGSDLAKRVRNAFDAYIFLSYRKKDRVYAQELMRLIHKSDRYRDIAIWYDEYLVPGEDFNASIQQALKKGVLFTLLVTPSLLEKDNYVMRYEYSAAVESGKPILPVEMVETELNKLEEFYRCIPDPVKVCEGEKIDKALARYLTGIASEKTDDPTHNFLIGLAYLDGIDVEVDNEKAVTLIKDAAETGLGEAVRKLVAMYHDGKGVERDYKESAVWQRKLVDICRKAWHENGDMQSLRDLVSELWNLAEVLYSFRDIQEAKTVYLEMRDYVLRQEEDEKLHNLLTIYCQLGNLEKGMGELQYAAKFYQEALNISHFLVKKTHSEMSFRDLAICYSELGDIDKGLGRLEDAKFNYQQSVIYISQLVDRNPSAVLRSDLSTGFIKLGSIEQKLGNLGGAKDYYLKALKIQKQLADETHTYDSYRDLARSYSYMGDIEIALGDLKEAKRCYQKMMEIREQLAEESHTVALRCELAGGYNRMGDIEQKQGNLEAAKKNYRKSLEISKQLVEETHTIESRHGMAVSYFKLGEIERGFGNVFEAKRFFIQAREIYEQLAEETQAIEFYDNLAGSYEKLGEITLGQKNPYRAKLLFQKALEIRAKVVEKTDSPDVFNGLSINYQWLAKTEQAFGNPEKAKHYFRKSLEVLDWVAEKIHTAEIQRNLAISYGQMGDIEQELAIWKAQNSIT